MSPPDLTSPRGVLPSKSKSDVYTVLLIISLVALLLACLFQFLEINTYGGFTEIRGTVGSLWPASGGEGLSSIWA